MDEGFVDKLNKLLKNDSVTEIKLVPGDNVEVLFASGAKITGNYKSCVILERITGLLEELNSKVIKKRIFQGQYIKE